MKSIVYKIAGILITFTLLLSCGSDDNEIISPPPTLNVENLNVSIMENPEINSIIGEFEVSQGNLTDPLVFELLEVSLPGALTINNQGQLLVADVTAFDFERREAISGEIEVSSGDLAQTASFTLSLLDVEEAPVPFITRWNLTAGDLTVQLPIYNRNTTYNFTVDWGDGIIGEVTSFDDPDATHTYDAEGIKTIIITGVLEGFNFNLNSNSSRQIIDVAQWGDMRLGNFDGHFSSCTNLTGFTASDTPILKEVTNMFAMFFNASLFNGDLSDWDVSGVLNMSFMFSGASSFNQHLSNWDVSNVRSMSEMFGQAEAFNGNISNWDVSSVISMDRMFNGASSFNNDISNWNISNVTSISEMFTNASSFNQNLSNWDVSNVTNIRRMFNGASSFNQDISNWDVSNITSMSGVFAGATAFNNDISNWDVANVTNMSEMFENASSFNGNLSNWDVANVTNMRGMFQNATSFNSDISGWNVANVNNMRVMFTDASVFSQDLSNWATDNVTLCENFANGSALTAAQVPTRGICF
ncbi:BspA family leucine-rich repeat surface protein [Flavobacteriaceae bacterium R38]|nr:BspA family leucine-rich repeat surface protein [Flavobacteriaceae bacterium R38]